MKNEKMRGPAARVLLQRLERLIEQERSEVRALLNPRQLDKYDRVQRLKLMTPGI